MGTSGSLFQHRRHFVLVQNILIQPAHWCHHLSTLSGMNLDQGVENAVRGKLAFWLQFGFALAFIAAAIFICQQVTKQLADRTLYFMPHAAI